MFKKIPIDLYFAVTYQIYKLVMQKDRKDEMLEIIKFPSRMQFWGFLKTIWNLNKHKD